MFNYQIGGIFNMGKVYTFWCEYDLGINDNIYKDVHTLREDVTKALDSCGLEESLEELEAEGLFHIDIKRVE